MKQGANIAKKIFGTIMLPGAMYIAMMILCYANGKMYFGTMMMWKTLIVDIAVSVTCALGIGLQFKCGRFDFSGGAIMLISAIVAGNISKQNGNNMMLFFGLCIVCCVALSVLVSLLYVYGRLPIIIATIGMALLYESVTCLMFNGSGINLVANMTLKQFSTYPLVLLPLGLSILVYVVFSYFTVTGKQADLLSMNQQAAVNIGINEKKNVIISYVFSGLIYGFATAIYASKGMHAASFSSLTTVGELFSNILPVFIGLMLAQYCGDAIGIIMGSITLCLMSYSLSAVFSAEMGSAVSTVITGLFIFFINVVSAQGKEWIEGIKNLFRKKKTA